MKKVTDRELDVFDCSIRFLSDIGDCKKTEWIQYRKELNRKHVYHQCFSDKL